MHRIAFFILLILVGTLPHLLAQIPSQPRINPNAVPPPNPGARPFVRPGANPVPAPANTPRPAGAANTARPAATPGANGNPAGEKPAMKPEDAIKEGGGVELQFPNTPLSQILLVYEDLTGLKIIRDANAEQATVSIETTGELPKDKAIMFIEKSLLLNGYSFVPAGEGMVKLLAFDAKKPQTEGAPFIESAMDLPQTDQVVNFVVILKYLNGEDAVKAIDQVIPRHSYGVLTPVPNAKALVITENSNTIRSILSLLERLDSKPAETVTETIQLTRSDAEDIKKALDEILGIDEKDASGSGRLPSIPQNQPGTVPGQSVQQPIPLNPTAQSGAGGSSAEAAPPKIYAILRRNCLLVTASAETMVYIKTLIQELDAPSELRNFVSRSLNYLGVESAMSVISDAITRTEGDSEGGSGSSSAGGLGQNGQNQNTTNTQTNQNRGSGLFGNNNNNGNSFGNNGLGGSNDFGGGLGGGMGGGGGASLQPLRQNNGPTSLLIGKTLLISDPIANTVFASGPPEHLRILNEIIDELDHRPQQIVINAVIGEHTVGSGFQTGMLTMLRNKGSDAFKIGNLSLGASGKLLDSRTSISLADLASSSGLTYFGHLGKGIDVALRLASADSDFQVLSRPTLFTTNNNPVTITSGQSIPIQSSSQNLGSAGGLISNVQYQDVLLSLSVVPLINTPDEITLQIAQSNSELGTERSIGGALYPELSKQEYNTTIVCRNKSAVLLGGLMRKDDRKSNSTIPFIGKIPILKHLTSDRSKTVSQRELLIFIEPRIVEGMHDLPPSVNDSAGTSIHSDNMRAAFQQERIDAATRAMPVEKLKASEKMKRMIKKLFE